MHYVFVLTLPKRGCSLHSACFHWDQPRFRCSAGGWPGHRAARPWGSLGPSVTSSAAAFSGGGGGRVVPSGTALWGALGRVGEHPEGARRRSPQDAGPGGARGARSRPGIRSPRPRIVRRSHFLWLYCLCPTPYCLISFCPPFSAAVFYFPASLVVFISFV